MRKIFLTAIFVVTLTIANICAAQDIWVTHWQSENLDIYAMDDTIRDTSSEDYKSFAVSAKFVKNGQLLKVVNWDFMKNKTGMWRYETSTMDGRHTTVVIPRSPLFEFCMNRLGWSYHIKDNNGVEYYY
jgi:hypothetical protein